MHIMPALKRFRETIQIKHGNATAPSTASMAAIVVFIISLTLFFAISVMQKGLWGPSKKSSVTYRDASDRLGYRATWSSLLDTIFAAGTCVMDANGDDLPDLFFPGLGDFNTDPTYLPGYRLGNALYINRGTDGSRLPLFEDITDKASVRNIGKLGVGCAVADYDNDGDEDIVVTNATRGVSFSFYGGLPIGGPRLFPPSSMFHTDKTDGKYDFPAEGGVTLFRNEGADEHGIPHFADVTLEAGLTRGGNGTSAAWADVENDGHADLFVANYSDPDFLGFVEPHFAGQYNSIYRNNGDGTFSDVTREAGMGGEAEFVYTPEREKHYGWSAEVVDSLGRTVGDPAGNTLAAAFLDYDDDGLPDLLTADDIPGRVRLYRNLGKFRFRQVSEENDMGVAGAWMGLGIGDIDNDDAEDVFGTNFGAPVSQLPAEFERAGETIMSDIFRPPNRATYYNGLWTHRADVFQNIAKDVVVDWGTWKPAIGWPLSPTRWITGRSSGQPSKPRGLQKGEFGFGALIFDYDNDGWQDIAWVGSMNRRAGFPFGKRGVGNPGRLLKNLGLGKEFADVGQESGFSNLQNKKDRTSYQNGRGLTISDFNGDGYYDIVITNAGGWDSGDLDIPRLSGVGFQYKAFSLVKEYRPGPTRLYISSPGSNHWLKIRLIGVRSNRSAIGARIRISYLEDGVMKKQMREVRAGESFASQKSLELIFGLGSAQEVREIAIRWPHKEAVESQIFRNIKADQRLSIRENIP